MEISYWQSRWKKGNTGWHMDIVFPPLREHWHRLELSTKATVLVPLCGKSLDIDWLTAQGHHVIGVDVSKRAVQEVMDRRGESFEQTSKGSFTIFRSPSLDLWCGDVFKLRKSWLPTIDAVYDKAANMALPPNIRADYAHTILSLLQPHSQILMNCFEYEQDEMNGPPFAVFEPELENLYGYRFKITLLQEQSLFDDLKQFQQRGLSSYLTEKIFHLKPQ